MARCSKNILNGPCGGTHDGKCEVSDEIDCVWALIVKRLTDMGTLDTYRKFTPAKDWRPGGAGGPRKMVREDLKAQDPTPKA